MQNLTSYGHQSKASVYHLPNKQQQWRSGLDSAGLHAAILARFMWGFPKIEGTLLGVPIIRIIVYWGLYWGPLILRNYHVGHPMCSEALVVTRPESWRAAS